MRKMEYCTCLRDPFRTYPGMMIDTKTCIEGHDTPYMLSEIHISRQFILELVYKHGPATCVLPCDEIIPCPAAIPEPVEADGNAVALEETCALIQGDSHHVIVGIESCRLRTLPFAWSITVVYPVISPIIKKTQSSRCPVILISDSQRCHSAGYTLVPVHKRRRHRAGI